MELYKELENLKELMSPVTHWKVDEMRELFKAFHNEKDVVEHARWQEFDRQLVMYGAYVNNLERNLTSCQEQMKKIFMVSKERKLRNRKVNGILQRLRVKHAETTRERNALAGNLVREVRGELVKLKKKVQGTDV